MNSEELEDLKKSAPPPFVPKLLPLDLAQLITPEVIPLISKANNAIGQYTGFIAGIPNPMLLLSPITTQEAVLSSKLEGTHATLEDILNHEAGINTEIKDDEIKEIQNYRSALLYALESISTVSQLPQPDSKSPLTIQIIKEMHKILLNNVRGNTKHPGQFKVGQNYVGSYSHISFTPLPPQLTEQYMSNLEVYLHKDDLDLLVQAAIIHAQFEMIHPFEDGNGRIGRLLIPLFLYYRDIIPLPIFYLSSFFNSDRDIYVTKLANISKNGAWLDWIKYFLTGVTKQAEINTQKATEILQLYNDYKLYSSKIKSYSYVQFLDFIFEHPIFTNALAIKHLKTTRQTCSSIFNKMEQLQMISSKTTGKQKTFFFNKLLSVVDR